MNEGTHLADLQVECELLQQSLGEAELRHRRGESSEPAILAVFSSFPRLLSLDRLREWISQWRALDASGDPAARHLRLLLGYAVEQLVSRTYLVTLEELGRRRSSYQLELGEWRLPFILSEGEIEKEGDRNRREAIERERLIALERWQATYLELYAELRRVAIDLGFSHLWEMWCSLHGWAPQPLMAGIETVLKETEDLYHDTSAWYFRRRLGAMRTEPGRHDILHLFHEPAWDRHFPPDRVGSFPRGVFEALDVPGDERERMILEEVAAPRTPDGARCIPLDIPAAVYLLVKPRAGADAGRQALEQTGLLLYYAHVSPELPFSLRGPVDRAISGVHSALLEGLVRSPAWVSHALGWSQAEEWCRFQQFRRLYILRRSCGLVSYLKDLWESDDPQGCREAYREAMQAAVGVNYPGAYYLADCDPFLGPVCTVRSALLVCQLTRHLVETLEADWFLHPGAYDALRGIWSSGAFFPPDQLAARWGRGEWDLTPLLEETAEFLA